ncbi:MAG: glycosyltransferase family 39 protein [Rubripirellula sp.]
MASTETAASKESFESDSSNGDLFAVVGSFKAQLASVCALAFLMRMMHVMNTFEVPTVVTLLGDARGYFEWGERIAAGNWYGDQTFYQAPLYPYFLALLFKVFGSSITAVRIVQSLLGVASVALLGIAGRRMFTPRVGVVAAIMLAVYPPAIYYDGIIQKASLAAFLLCGLLAACATLRDRPRVWLAVLTGATLGLLVITRENALLWVPIVPFWIAVAFSPETLQKRLVLAASCVGGLALILLPVAARNASLGGEWSPTTFQAGPNFYIGNNALATGIYQPLVAGHETPMFERADAQRLAEQALGKTLSAREVSKFWMARSFDEIKQNPVRWVQLLFAKTLMVVNRYEVPDVESMYVFREYSLPLKVARLWHFGILFPVAIWGLIVTRANWRELWLYHLLTATMIAAVAGFFILGRYRLPVAVLAIPFAAVGLIDLFTRVRAKRSRPITIAIGAVLLVAVGCNFRVHDEASLNASSYMNLGVSAGRSGNLRESIEWLEKAITAFPESAESNFNLGRAWSISKQPAKAIPCYQRALLVKPNLVGADRFLAMDLERIGQPQAALVHYRRAIEIDPNDEASRAGIARISGQ